MITNINSLVALVYSAFGNIEGFFGDWMGLDWGGVEQTLDYWFPEAGGLRRISSSRVN